MSTRFLAFASALLLSSASLASAQQGYEFEVYGANIGNRGSSELELHTNFVPDGLTSSEEGVIPTHRAVRSSLEFGHTINEWLRGSVYLTSFAGQGRELTYVGNRARLTAVAPKRWALPFDLALANEISYARPGFSENRWAYELTPIIAKQIGAVSLTLNPALERGIGNQSEHEIELEPRGQLAYSFGDEGSFALEYYAGLGGIGESKPMKDQRHQLFARMSAEVAPRLELSLGAGRGLTRTSDRWVIATVIEYELKR